jgi:hypothetical protein
VDIGVLDDAEFLTNVGADLFAKLGFLFIAQFNIFEFVEPLVYRVGNAFQASKLRMTRSRKTEQNGETNENTN